MLNRLGRVAVHRARSILILAVIGLVAAGFFGGSVFTKLSSGGFNDPNAESVRGTEAMTELFGSGNPNLVLLVTAKDGSVDDSQVAREAGGLVQALEKEDHVEQVVSYWTLGSPPPLRSEQGHQALILARIAGTDDEVNDRVEPIADEYTIDNDTLKVGVGGQAEVFREVGDQIESDLRVAESITFPIVLLLLVIVFGSVIAAGLPLAIGAVAVLGTFLILSLLAGVTDVSVYSINLTTAMGLGLGIDYSLFIVSRYREELGRGLATGDAVVRTVETAGKTVLFSALTVAVSLAALLVFPMFFLRSFAYAGIAVVGLASVGAIVILPALLALIGPRIDKWVLFKRPHKEAGTGFWHRVATFVMHRPIPIALGVAGIMVLLGLPFLGVKFGLPDDRVLPTSAPAHQVQQQIRENFLSQEAGALSVVAQDAPATAVNELATYAADLSTLDGVSRVDALTGSYIDGEKVLEPGPISQRFKGDDATWLSVVPDVEPNSAAGEELVKDVRSTPAPFDVLVTGPSADLVDSKEGIFSRLPMAGALIAIVTFVVLFLMTGSVLVPTKAIILNLLSLTATYGAMVWIFQEGHFSGFLNFTPTGTLDSTNPILMFCVAFGLSMDYEVFLLSRIKEEYDRTGDNIASVAMGLEKTGRIVTAAAALLAVVFIAFATSQITFIKMIGIGLALAVVMDATLIRGALVPAFMRLAGRANWWAPAPLRRFHDRFGLKESSEPAPDGLTSGATP
jgi:putative drug exporter of the RND superfamily